LIITDLSEAPLSGASQTLAKNLIARLNATYPAFYDEQSGQTLWSVTVNEGGGVVMVTNLALSGKWGFLMHINKIDPEGRKVVRAAGELLERYRISRSMVKSVAYDSLAVAKRDWKGDLVADHG
jgi:hypothetical protein